VKPQVGKQERGTSHNHQASLFIHGPFHSSTDDAMRNKSLATALSAQSAHLTTKGWATRRSACFRKRDAGKGSMRHKGQSGAHNSCQYWLRPTTCASTPRTNLFCTWRVEPFVASSFYIFQFLFWICLRLFQPRVLERFFNATAHYSSIRWQLELFPCKPDLTFTLVTARPM
jgi:hypothetical protein